MLNDLGHNRAWGTRFSLLSNSNSNTSTPAPVSIPPSPAPSVIKTHTDNHHDIDWSATPAPTPAHPVPTLFRQHLPPVVPPQQSQYPHNASVFVASLPTGMPETDLREALGKHFAAHHPVMHVKIIPGSDSRHSVCAFVQAYSAEDAASFIDTFHLSFFQGRQIRCEPARALRTLFVSYKHPLVTPRIPRFGIAPLAPGHLPYSIRLRRERGTRLVSVLFDSDADLFNVANPANRVSFPNPMEPLSHAGLYISNVSYNNEVCVAPVVRFCGMTLISLDLQTLRTICAAFGQLEFFRPAQIPDELPHPHDQARHKAQSTSTLEVKWVHRNDAVSAQNVLSELPFVAVSWAHMHSFHPDASAPRPAPRFVNGRFGSTGSTDKLPAPLEAPGPLAYEEATAAQTSDTETSLTDTTDRFSRPPFVASITHADLSPTVVSSVTATAAPPSSGPTDRAVVSPNFPITEHDFPPLSNSTSSPGFTSRSANSSSVWGKLSAVSTSPEVEPVISEVDQRLHFREDDADDENEVETQEIAPTSRSPTPALVSPTDSTDNIPSSVPPTPIFRDFSVRVGLPIHAVEERKEDPYTLFVGGILVDRPPMWEEANIREFYGQYGAIEDVRLVKPFNKPVAFAFVRFASSNSTYRAIDDHPNRDHQGQPIKLRLKDAQPYRGWQPRNARGRGGNRRFMQSHESDGSGFGAPTATEIAIEQPIIPSSPTVFTIARPLRSPDIEDGPKLERTLPGVKMPGIDFPHAHLAQTHGRSFSQSTTSSTDVDSPVAPPSSEDDLGADTSGTSFIVHAPSKPEFIASASEPPTSSSASVPMTTSTVDADTTDDTAAARAQPKAFNSPEEPLDTPRPFSQAPATAAPHPVTTKLEESSPAGEGITAAHSHSAMVSSIANPQVPAYPVPPYFYPYPVAAAPYYSGPVPRANVLAGDKSPNLSTHPSSQANNTSSEQPQQPWQMSMPMYHSPYGMSPTMYDHHGMPLPFPWFPTGPGPYGPSSSRQSSQLPQANENGQAPSHGQSLPQHHPGQVWMPQFYHVPQMWMGMLGHNAPADGHNPAPSAESASHVGGNTAFNPYATPFNMLRQPFPALTSPTHNHARGSADKLAPFVPHLSISANAPAFRPSGPATPIHASNMSHGHPHNVHSPAHAMGDQAQAQNPYAFAPYHPVMMQHNAAAAAAAAQMQHVPNGRFGAGANAPPQW
ncbi:hypothetical protein BKA62DRAFT_222613 [Auriculariales sp. MPI-PUGE-AT-0066]|nr:hypothetical protein BKA62DRAFT_222613 [Auriculariales sp. MPI-PUGE-AT-0066]